VSSSQTKFFTPQEANQTLPLVRKIVDDILEVGKKIRAVSIEVGAHAEQDPQITKLMDQLEDLFVELEDLGCSYRDWNFTMGLVDFPSVIDGEEVLLCWRSDEPEVLYYHGLEDGFAGRKKIHSK
jgi:hypothetical protein